MAFAGGGIWWWQTAGGAPPPAPEPVVERRGGHRIPGESLAEFRDLTRDAILARRAREAPPQQRRLERNLVRRAKAVEAAGTEAERLNAQRQLAALLGRWQAQQTVLESALASLQRDIAKTIYAELARLEFEAQEDEAISLLLLME